MIKAILKKTSNLLNNQSLHVKLFIYTAFLIVLPMTIIGLISFQKSHMEMEREARNYSRQIIDQVQSHIEYYFSDFEVTTLKIVNHPDTIRLLSMVTSEQVNDSDIRRSVEILLKNAAYSRPDISNITIVLDDIQVIDCFGIDSPHPADRIRNEYWYSQIPWDASPVIVTRLIKWPEKTEPVISIVKRLYNPNTLRPVGLLVLDVNYRRIQEISEKVNYNVDRKFFILDNAGHYVYHPDNSKLGTKADFTNVENVMLMQEGSLVAGMNRHLLTFTKSNSTGWIFLTEISYQELLKGMVILGETIVWTMAVTLIIAYILGMFLIYGAVLKPIARLQSYMGRVEKGDLEWKIAVESKDEVGQLTEGFNKMVKRLSQLLEEAYFSKLRETQASLQAKEMEIKILQSQVNPHFLGNSLETIRGMALESDMDDIANMAASLGLLLRYNLQNNKTTVTLREEIYVCELYLQIQQYRFDKKISYRVEIPSWAWSLSVAKFSLQPLVENYFIHGIRHGTEPGEITISVVRDSERDVRVVVADTGVGIDENNLALIRERLNGPLDEESGSKIGLLNVHRRIAHIYGVEYGIIVESRIGEGTNVNIVLPYKLIDENL